MVSLKNLRSRSWLLVEWESVTIARNQLGNGKHTGAGWKQAMPHCYMVIYQKHLSCDKICNPLHPLVQVVVARKRRAVELGAGVKPAPDF